MGEEVDELIDQIQHDIESIEQVKTELHSWQFGKLSFQMIAQWRFYLHLLKSVEMLKTGFQNWNIELEQFDWIWCASRTANGDALPDVAIDLISFTTFRSEWIKSELNGELTSSYWRILHHSCLQFEILKRNWIIDVTVQNNGENGNGCDYSDEAHSSFLRISLWLNC